MLNTPTILFESGHFANVYAREEKECYNFLCFVLEAVELLEFANIGAYAQNE